MIPVTILVYFKDQKNLFYFTVDGSTIRKCAKHWVAIIQWCEVTHGITLLFWV